MPYCIKVVHKILVLSVEVRILLGQLLQLTLFLCHKNVYGYVVLILYESSLLSAISCETSSTFLFMCIECVPAIIKKKSINRDDTLLIDNEILFNLFLA